MAVIKCATEPIRVFAIRMPLFLCEADAMRNIPMTIVADRTDTRFTNLHRPSRSPSMRVSDR